MKPIEDKERYTLSKIVSDNLRKYIMENKMTTGDKLPSERDLASMLEVSRVIIREALRSLESTGIIVIRHGEGAFVNTDDSSIIFNHLLFFWQMNNEKIEELFELRHLLEKTAIEQLIANTEAEHLEKLNNIIDRMSHTTDPKLFKQLDIEFHRGLIQATNNELFSQLTDIIVQYFSSVPHSQMDQDNRNKTVYEHKMILEALKNKNKELALQLLSEHLQYSKKFKISHTEN
ncbi:FadR/GntR family transcriptional regulator [Bacillus sp. FSL K6-3431]|uniref:FadR/GntR family transcriptional regulator n=1 Tax=Bacillus sp. FSL K6-3431 TaxID=2921500 RepID=UPI0030F9E5A4